eukprot:Pgem_evm1s2493
MLTVLSISLTFLSFVSAFPQTYECLSRSSQVTDAECQARCTTSSWGAFKTTESTCYLQKYIYSDFSSASSWHLAGNLDGSMALSDIEKDVLAAQGYQCGCRQIPYTCGGIGYDESGGADCDGICLSPASGTIVTGSGVGKPTGATGLCNYEGEASRCSCTPNFFELFLASPMESCDTACAAKGKTCDPYMIDYMAATKPSCCDSIESAGLSWELRGRYYSEGNAGCTYHSGGNGYCQLYRPDGEIATCSATVTDSSRSRLCYC